MLDILEDRYDDGSAGSWIKK